MEKLLRIGFWISVVTTVFLLNIENLNAQDESTSPNSIYLSYGNIILSDQISVAYERRLFKKNNLSTQVKLNYGHYLNNNGDYDTNARLYKNHISLSGVQLIKWFEVNAGIAYTEYNLARGSDPEPNVDYDDDKNRFDFYGSIGIRIVKDNFLFRAGLGNLELLFIGIGGTF